MSVNPPQPSRSPSTSSAKKTPEEELRKKGKEFKLPNKTGKKEEEEKKKTLFALAQEVMAEQGKQQHFSAEMQKVEKGEAIAPKEAAAQVAKISQLVLSLVDSLHVAEVGGKGLALLNLKDSSDVPAPFAGSTISLTQQDEGLIIHFDNFADPQQQNLAITLVEKNKEQLEDMIQALNAKNIQVAELSLGEHVITLPRVIPPQTPIQPIALAARSQSSHEQREQGKEGRDEKERE